MHRSLRTELRREIRSSLTRFLSILVMVGLGVMFLVGLRSAAPDMRATADDYFDDMRLFDVQVLSTLGLTQADIAVFSRTEGVETARGGWTMDAILTGGEEQRTVKILSITENMNIPVLLEGRMPESPDECVVDEKLVSGRDLSLGDTVMLETRDDMENALTTAGFTITGIVDSPLYISLDRGTSTLGDGSVAAFVLLPEDSFGLDYYTVANITAAGARELSAYSGEYKALLEELTARLEESAEQRGQLRYEILRSDAERQIDEAQQRLDDGKNRADREIADAQQELDDARQELDDGWATLDQAKQNYDAALELTGGEAENVPAQSSFAAAMEGAAREIDDGEQELLDGEQEYQDGLQALEDAKRESADRIADSQAEIDQAREKLDALKPAEIYVLDRNSNYGFVSYDQNAERMENLARVFPVIFFVVAALVCLTTMTRMVEEQRTQIGTIKAMGYGTGTISAKYVIYGVTAALGGSLPGAVFGATLIPWVIFSTYGIMYNLPSLHLRAYWGLILITCTAGVACTVAATLWAVFSTARQSPAALMRPKAPRAGRRILLERITPIWKRLSFSMKVSARNLFRYRKRFWMTVIGVAGCTALLISGLRLRSSIFDIIDIQFEQIYRYNVAMTVDPESPGIAQRVEETLDRAGNVSDRAKLNTRNVTFQAGNASVDGYLSVTDDPVSLCREIELRDMDTKSIQEIPENGMLIDKKLAEQLDLQEGSTLTIDCGSRITVTVCGILEHYVYHYAYMSAAQFSALTGEDYVPNEYLVTVEDPSDEAVRNLCEELMAVDGVRSATDLKAMARTFRDTLNAVNAAVMIIIISAAALALVVLYNLTNINITERIRELATIKVLGFYDTEVAMYIYRENIVLTLMGIILGQFFGKYLSAWLVRTVEMDIVMFGREAKLENYVFSVILSLVFALLVNIAMFFRLRKIDMIQSLKSVE